MDVDQELARPEATELKCGIRQKDAQVLIELEWQIERCRQLPQEQCRFHTNGRGID